MTKGQRRGPRERPRRKETEEEIERNKNGQERKSLKKGK